MRRLWLAVALLAVIVPTALAGGLHAKVEGPARDGVTYTVRTYSCDANTTLEPWGLAEGVVDGKPQSVLLRIVPTETHGVYQFERKWPKEGHWMIRVSLGHPPAPATVTTLRADGSVQDNKLYWKTDGQPECRKALQKYLDPKFDADC